MTTTVNNLRVSAVGRFDTVVFNPRTKVLQVWRYSSGLYQGVHDIVFSINANWINDEADLLGAVSLIREVAGLLITSEEPNLPSPWKGYRFT